MPVGNEHAHARTLRGSTHPLTQAHMTALTKF
jgi:hypothetical protein